MKRIITIPTFLMFLFASVLVLSSFSTIPNADVRDDNPPVEKKATKEDRQKARLNKRYNRLHERFDKATNSQQRLRLQKKIRNVERQQATNGSPLWGIIGLALGILSFVLFVVSFSVIVAFAEAFATTGVSNPGGVIAVYALGLVAALAGLVISIVSLILIAKNPDRHSMKGFGIAGIIVGSIFTIILGIFFAIFVAVGQYL